MTEWEDSNRVTSKTGYKSYTW